MIELKPSRQRQEDLNRKQPSDRERSIILFQLYARYDHPDIHDRINRRHSSIFYQYPKEYYQLKSKGDAPV